MRDRAFSLLLLATLASMHVRAESLQDYTGGELFGRFCASCHGTGGQGDGPVANALPALVPDLSRIAEQRGGKFPEDDIRKIIDGRAVVVYHGTRYMPVWGYEFWVEEGADIEASREANALIDKLVAYVREIQRANDDAVETAVGRRELEEGLAPRKSLLEAGALVGERGITGQIEGLQDWQRAQTPGVRQRPGRSRKGHEREEKSEPESPAS